MNYPTLVYRRWRGERKVMCDAEYKGVYSAEEHLAARADGWFDSVPEALAPPQQPDASRAEPQEPPEPEILRQTAAQVFELQEAPPDDAPPTRAELEEMAKELGIKVDGRWSDARLRTLIDEKLK